MARKATRKAANQRLMYRQTLDALERGKLPDGEERELLVRIGRALLDANPTDQVRTVADLGKPFRLPGDHEAASEFHRRCSTLSKERPTAPKWGIERKVQKEMGIKDGTASRYRNHTPGMLRVESRILKRQRGGD